MSYLRRRAGMALWCMVVVGLSTLWAAAQAQPTKAPPTAESQPAQEIAPSVELTRPGTFRISVRGADLRGVLQLLSTQGKKNIVATKDVAGKVTADLYDVTFKEALEAVLESSGFVYREKGNFIYVYTRPELEKIQAAERKMEVRSFRLAYITANDAKSLIQPAMSKDGTIAITPAPQMGIAQSNTETGGNNYAAGDVLVIRDYEENLARVAEIIRELDVKPDQVLIEATILRAKLTEDNALGVDFSTLAGIDFQGLNATSAGLSNVTPGNLSGSELNRRAASFRTDFNSAVPTGGMTIGFIANETAFFIRALEGVTDTTVLANPKLLVINKQRGEVMVGNKDGYLTTTFTETTATQTVQFLETGTRLVVRPFIGRDGYIRLEIHPEDSSGAVRQVANSALPTETTTEVTSNVLVRDGHTIVIGGLFREETTAGRAQVPLLGNLPYVGMLFRNTLDNTKREEVIILITPRIVRQATDEAVSEQIATDVERIRVGNRKGLRWWGRSRLAEAYVSAAKKALAEGDPAKALWNIDLALSMDPRMAEAIRIKEKLTEKAYWSDSAQDSSIRFVIQQMMMQEMGKSIQRIVPPYRPLDPDKIEQEVRKALGIEKRPEDPLPAIPKAKPAPQETKAPGPDASGKAAAPKAPPAPTPQPKEEPKPKEEARVIIRGKDAPGVAGPAAPSPAPAQPKEEPKVKGDQKVVDQKSDVSAAKPGTNTAPAK